VSGGVPGKNSQVKTATAALPKQYFTAIPGGRTLLKKESVETGEYRSNLPWVRDRIALPPPLNESWIRARPKLQVRRLTRVKYSGDEKISRENQKHHVVQNILF